MGLKNKGDIVGSFDFKKDGIKKTALKYSGVNYDIEDSLDYLLYLLFSVLLSLAVTFIFLIVIEINYAILNYAILNDELFLVDEHPDTFKFLALCVHYTTIPIAMFYFAFRESKFGTKKIRIKSALKYMVLPITKLKNLIRLLSKKRKKELEDTILMVKTVAVFDEYLEGVEGYENGVNNKAQLIKQYEEVEDFLNRIVDVDLGDGRVYVTRCYNLLNVGNKGIVINRGFEYSTGTELYKTSVVDVPELDKSGVERYLTTLEEVYNLDKEYNYLTKEYNKIKINDKKYKEELLKVKEYIEDFDERVKLVEDDLFITQSKKREDKKLKVEEELRELKNKEGVNDVG